MRGRGLIVLSAIAIALAGCGAGDDEASTDEARSGTPTSVPDGAVAVVGETEISREDYDAWAKASVAQAGGEPPKGEALRDQVMQFLLSAEWIAQEAEARGIEASDDEVRQQFEEQKEQSFPKESDYQEFLRTSGQTEEQLLFRVRLDVLSNKVREEAVRDAEPPTDEEIRAHYEKNRSDFEGQSLADARETIASLLKSQKEQEVLDEFVKDFEQRYREITLCADEYVTEDCSNADKPATTPEEEKEEEPPGPIDRLLER